MKEEIKKQIAHYFEGTTSLEEEKQLRDYFSSGEVDEELMKYQPLFTLYQQEQEVKMPKEATITLSNGKPYRPHQSLGKTWRRYAATVAACAVIAVSLYFLFSPVTNELLCENYVIVDGKKICDMDVVNYYTDDVLNKIDELVNESDRILEEQEQLLKDFNITE